MKRSLDGERFFNSWHISNRKNPYNKLLNTSRTQLEVATNILTDVSETSIITLRSRVIESKRSDPIIHDDTSSECLDKIGLLLSKDVHERLIEKKFPPALARHITIRALKYDLYTKEFLKKNPDGLVVSLGCGFDTRYWRISDIAWKYVELDLPNVIEAKREILKSKMAYLTIGCSVLDYKWISEVIAIQNKHVLFLAEGLFMYLPQKDVEDLFRKLSLSFSESCIVFETVNKKYTRGVLKKMVELKMKRAAGSTAGSSYKFGVTNGKEIETYGKNIKLVEEWSYFEDANIEPKILWYLKNLKFFTRTQWTLKVMIG